MTNKELLSPPLPAPSGVPPSPSEEKGIANHPGDRGQESPEVAHTGGSVSSRRSQLPQASCAAWPRAGVSQALVNRPSGAHEDGEACSRGHPHPSLWQQELPCPVPALNTGRGSTGQARTPGHPPAAQQGPLPCVKQLNSAVELWFTSFSPSPFWQSPVCWQKSQLRRQTKPPRAGAAPRRPVAHPVCPPPRCGSPKGLRTPEPGSAFSPWWHGAQRAAQRGRL